MSYLNYDVGKIFLLFFNQLSFSSFISVILSCILLGIIIYINKEKGIMKNVFICINAILLIFIVCLYIKGILTFNFFNPLKNIYVYFFNSLIYLIFCIVLNKKIYQNNYNLILYILNQIGIVYSVIMTLYLKNIPVIVIGNIFPQIFFGNILLIVSYLILIFQKVKDGKR